MTRKAHPKLKYIFLNRQGGTVDSNNVFEQIFKQVSEIFGSGVHPILIWGSVCFLVLVFGFFSAFVRRFADNLAKAITDKLWDSEALDRYRQVVAETMRTTLEDLKRENAPIDVIDKFEEKYINVCNSSPKMSRAILRVSIRELRSAGFEHLTRSLVAIYAMGT
jgi:hypothetical protein